MNHQVVTYVLIRGKQSVNRWFLIFFFFFIARLALWWFEFLPHWVKNTRRGHSSRVFQLRTDLRFKVLPQFSSVPQTQFVLKVHTYGGVIGYFTFALRIFLRMLLILIKRSVPKLRSFQLLRWLLRNNRKIFKEVCDKTVLCVFLFFKYWGWSL